MDRKPKKFGWTALGIVGMVFAPIGLFFVILGVLLWHYQAGRDPEDPEILLWVFCGMGALFLVLGLAFVWLELRRRKRMKDAYDSGNYVMAKIAGIQTRSNVRVNGRSPYVVECHYTDPDSGKAQICYSRYLYFNPSGLLTSDEVPVYIDRYDGKTVFVDIDSVLPEFEIHK